jgi:hypothetical protein
MISIQNKDKGALAMNKYIKALAILIATTCLYTLQIVSFGDYTTVSSDTEIEKLAPGIEYIHRMDFTNRGFININVLKMDYDDPNVEMDLLKSDESISKRSTLTQFAASEPTLYGAVNGDFFNYDFHTTIGPMVEDGVVYSSPINDPEFSSFNITKTDKFLIHNWAQTFFRLEKEGFKLPIDYVNKPYFDGNKVILFNNDWANLTKGNTHTSDILEMLVVDGEIKEITLNGGPKIIPDNGYVIAAVGNKIPLIQNNFNLFDQVSFVKDDSFDAIDFSIGGGTRLLKNSTIVDNFTLGINGRHPRTAIGYTADRKVLLVTVDGRSTSYPGVTQTELANILLELGVTDAINLDGGGSTAMIKKDLVSGATQVVNKPSDGQERRVQNAVGFKGYYPVSDLDHLKITPAYPRVFANDSVEMAITPYDVSNNKLSQATITEAIQWTILDGEGSFKENTYYPTSPGIHKLQADLGQAQGQTTIRVLKDLAALSITPEALTLKPGAKVTLTAKGVSSDGYYAPIKPENITWLMTGNTGTLTENGLFVANDTNGSGMIRASFHDLETYIPVVVGTETRLIHDFESQLGSFVSYPAEVTGKYSLIKFGENDSFTGKLEYNFKNTDATRAAYIDFGENLVLKDMPDQLSLSVFGNYGNNHWLRAKIKDGNGQKVTINFQQNVSWEGWKTVNADIPDSLVAPLTIERIYLVETDAMLKDAGAIVIDNLTGVFQPTFTDDIPKNISKVAHIEEFMLFGEANYTVSSKTFDIKGLTKERIGNTTLLKINNKNNGIRKNDFNQWITLLNTLKESTSHPLVLVMASSPDFTDTLEQELFYDKLEKASEKRSIAIVFPNKRNSYRMERGIELIGVEKSDTNILAMQVGDTLSFEIQTIKAAE